MDKTMKEKSLIIKKYKDMFETFRLDYEGTSFSADGNTHWELEFNLKNEGDLKNIKTPYGKEFGGTETAPKPCSRNGFLWGENNTTVPEWKSEELLEIDDGSLLNKVVDGKVVERYRFESGKWVKI